jgi:hypothetical protein
MQFGWIKRTGAAAGVAALLSSTPASADILRYDGAWYAPYYSSFTIRDTTPSPLSLGVYAGAFRMTDVSGPTLPAGSSFMAWCVDIYHHLDTSSAGAAYTRRSGNEFYGAGSPTTTRLEQLASYVVDSDANALTTTLQSALTGNLQSAAFQLAVWEIVNEGTSAALNVISGDFYVTGSSAVTTLANQWLANSQGWATTQHLAVWDGPNTTQDLAVFAPIPEPQTFAMLLAGLGLMGFVARRRQRNLAAA